MHGRTSPSVSANFLFGKSGESGLRYLFESDHFDPVTLKRGIAISVPVNSMTVDNHLREWFQNKQLGGIKIRKGVFN